MRNAHSSDCSLMLWEMHCFFFFLNSEPGPVCEEAYAYIEVAEDSPVGTVVKEIQCARSSASSRDLTYAIKDGNTNGKFGINSTNGVGVVFVYQSISFESRTTNFQISVEVSETSPYRSSVNYVLDIQITGVNDYAPLFLFSPYTVYVNEDMGPGEIVAKPIPYDFDKGNDGSTTSSIIEGDDSMFYMDPETAKVYLRKNLDYEQQRDYVINIQVTDKGFPAPKSSTSVINVHVKDKNDNRPQCEDTYLTETFEETKEEGAIIMFIKCSDADTGNNGRLSYTIVNGDYTKFRLQGPYLLLSKAVDVDREPNTWTLTVLVRDRGNPRLSVSVDIVLYVEGVDDNSPIWAPPLNGRYLIDVEENTPIGTQVIQISADDLDKSESRDAAVIYYMDDYTHVFTIKPKTGEIFLNRDLDREKVSSYTIPVSAVSIDNPGDRITTDVIINVIDVNDFTPEFEKDVFQYFIRENVRIQTEIANVSAKDLDIGVNGEVIYMIVDGNTDSVFDVDTKTGLISVVGRLDYESETTYSVQIRAVDRGRPARSSTCTVILTIVPVNEFAPLVQDMNTLNILEDTAIGLSIFQIEASDGDRGLDGTLLYSIVSGGEPFVIEPLTGTVRLLQELDRESVTAYNVLVDVSDMSVTQRKSTRFTVDVSILDVNDNAPTCDMFYQKTLSPPILSGDVIVQLNCTDKDEGQNSKLSYSILSGNINSDMSISYDGGLTVLRNPSAAEYRLHIEIRDGGTPSLNTQAIVVVTTGGKPVFKNLPGSVDVLENVDIGTSVFKVQSLSVSKQIKYEITEVNTDENDVAFPTVVKIDAFTGTLYTWNALDFESTSKIHVGIRATDTISRIEVESTLTIIVVDLNDNRPVFDKSIYNISVVENMTPMTSLLRVSVTDPDSGTNGLFDLSIDQNGADTFVINEGGYLMTRSTIDREKTDRYTLVLTATDRGSQVQLTGSATVLVLVLDSDEYSPEFIDVAADLETRLAEDTPLGAKVFVLEARDFDITSELKYSLQPTTSDNFLIDEKTGSIYLSRLLDREREDRYILVVQVADDGELTATATVTVIVTDINDNDPQFTSRVLKFDVSESFDPGHVVGTIVVQDEDLGENGETSLSIVDGNVGGVFDVRNEDLVLSGSLEYDKITQYLLIVAASDNGVPRRTSTATVIVEVEPDLKAPMFALGYETINVPENLYIGYVLFDCDATLLGAKEGITNELVYTLMSGNKNGIFGLDKKTGQITIARSLDRELNGDFYNLVVMAANMYDTSLKVQLELEVSIDDINDIQPAFLQDRYSLEVKENEVMGWVLGSVSAVDGDYGQNAKISYEIDGGADVAEVFSIDAQKGEISLKRKLNFLYDQVFHFSVTAYDHGSPSLSGKTAVTVNVIDVNNNGPQFDQDVFSVSIRENVEAGKQIFQVNTHDLDTGINGEVLLRIVGGNDLGCFELDSENGKLRISKTLDREKVSKFELHIEAEDKGSPSLTGSGLILISVSDVNDNIPQFGRPVYTVSLNRFSSIETSVITVTAVDDDLGENADIDYHLTGDSADYFQINSVSGRIETFADLSLLENAVEVTVVAKDRGSPRLSSSTIIDVQLHPTKFKDPEDYSFSVSEYDSPNTFIGTIGSQSGMKYAIVKGNFKNNFRISEEDGNIFLRGILDREEYSDYFLVISSHHQLTPNLESKLNVHIKVRDENDNNPTFSQDENSFSVLEHSPIGYSVVQLTATDRDIGENGNLSYFIVEDEASSIFSIDTNGSIFVQKSISYETIKKVNFTIVAVDNGQFSRSGSMQVSVEIVDIDEGTFEQDGGPRSTVVSVQLPCNAQPGYLIVKLTPYHFGFGTSEPSVRYLTNANKQVFAVDEVTGDVELYSLNVISSDNVYWLWTVAQTADSDGGKEGMVLLRIECYNPVQHVVVFTHSVSAQVLDINRKLFQEKLGRVFPSTYPVVWKVEGEKSQFTRRKLLQLSSKSYVYFLRSNATRFELSHKKGERFLHQDELMAMLTEKDGGVAEVLNSEAFDNFPVVSVGRYIDQEEVGESWLNTPMGILTIAICVTIALLLLIVLVVVLIKKKYNGGLFAKLKLNGSKGISPEPKCVEPLYNNIKSKTSLTETVPVMETLRLLAKMSEDERNEILQKAFNTKQTDDILALNTNSNKATSVQFMVQDETNAKAPRKVSNEDAEVNTKVNDNKHGLKEKRKISDISTFEETPTIVNDGRKTSFDDEDSPRRRSTLASVSSLELEVAPAPSETASESEVIVSETDSKTSRHAMEPIKNNKTLIIGGKEYDGVGKDTKTNGKYLYNTRTGDKLHVTDDILKRAVEQRQSVVHAEFNEAVHGGRVSTFKRPLKRKMSRSRFSTTTIWEMSVDGDNGGEPTDDVLSDKVFMDTDGHGDGVVMTPDKGRQRRVGIDHSGKRNQPPPNVALVCNTEESKVDELRSDDSEAGDDIYEKVEEIVPQIEETSINEESDTSEDAKEEDDQLPDIPTEELAEENKPKDAISRKISANVKWEQLLAAKVPKQSDNTSNGVKMENKWTKAQKVVKYVRPTYKPINLDNVTCKVPKGKSDPKDCLSKDPVYVGWAKMVGRRMKKKVVKTKDGPSKTVVSREGRSLPASLFATQKSPVSNKPTPKDVMTYTKIVSSLVPPHLARKRPSLNTS